MTAHDAGAGSTKRNAGLALGGLAAGAILGAGLAAQPAQAGAATGADQSPPTTDHGDVAAAARPSIRDQFNAAFAPGAISGEFPQVAILIPSE